MVKTGGIKTQKPEKSMFRTNANNVLRHRRLLKYTVVFYFELVPKGASCLSLAEKAFHIKSIV